VIRKLDVTILKGILESRSSDSWACFIVEVPKHDLLCSICIFLKRVFFVDHGSFCFVSFILDKHAKGATVFGFQFGMFQTQFSVCVHIKTLLETQFAIILTQTRTNSALYTQTKFVYCEVLRYVSLDMHRFQEVFTEWMFYVHCCIFCSLGETLSRTKADFCMPVFSFKWQLLFKELCNIEEGLV